MTVDYTVSVQAWAAVISAFSTIILVAITAYYAWQTAKTVREMEASRREMETSRRHGLMPIISHNIRLEDRFERGGLQGTGNVIEITNVGNAPALNVRLRAEQQDGRDSIFDFKPVSEDFLTAAADKDRIGQALLVANPRSEFKTHEAKIKITTNYENAYGVQMQTTALVAFCLDNQQDRWRWKNRSEEVIVI